MAARVTPSTESRLRPSTSLPGQSRAVIDRVSPEIDAGRFPIKRIAGDRVEVEADVFVDGHDALRVELLHRKAGRKNWHAVPMEDQGNDLWTGAFTVPEMGTYSYTVRAWLDPYLMWSRDLAKRVDAGQDVELQFAIGAGMLRDAASRAGKTHHAILTSSAEALESGEVSARVITATSPSLVALAARYLEPPHVTTWPRTLDVTVDRERAVYSAWYELFPRSTAPQPGEHGTFLTAAEHLPYVAEMGFDVLYLPPIHPVGTTKRKGRNNAVVAEDGEPGSPWAIGSPEGGHTAINPALGTLEDFHTLASRAQELGMELALDIAFQCSPDHPWVQEHPQWFRWRPDGTVQFAENPPKRYEDIYPINFETDDWRNLWAELRGVFQYWINQGVRIFRVDNPHTKSFAFWEWAISSIRQKHPDVIFLAEAFTRPKVMKRLAKLGFTQSYTYFAWRNERWDITEYFTELTTTEMREYFRPNLWPNTPDILTETLQTGARPAFMGRLVLAATLGANYGIYGPAFELMEHLPLMPGSEEYLNSEKYEVRSWDYDRPDTLAPFIGLVNRIRRENPALHRDRNLRFHDTDNEHLVCYSKTTDDLANVILVVANLDPFNAQSGWVTLDLAALGLPGGTDYVVHDLLTNARYSWNDATNYVLLNPESLPAHVFRIERADSTEPAEAAPSTAITTSTEGSPSA